MRGGLDLQWPGTYLINEIVKHEVAQRGHRGKGSWKRTLVTDDSPKEESETSVHTLSDIKLAKRQPTMRSLIVK